MNICLCFSKNWSQYVTIEIFSLVKNNIDTDTIKIYLMSEDLTKNELQYFDNLCNYFGDRFTYKYIDMKDFYNKFMYNTVNVDNRFTKFTNFRLAIPYLIEDDRILYIDTDALVCKNISEFYNMEFENAWIIGCEDVGLQKGHKLALGKKESDLYLNAGIMLMDLYKIRESKIADQWLHLLKTRHFSAHDQDILFITIPKFKKVHFQYNTSLSTGLEISSKDISIAHYAGVKHPVHWVKGLPFSEIWNEIEQEYNSIFNNYKLQNKINKTIAYCWFGKGQKSQLIQNCINSWRKYCPDYSIVELNEENCDVNYNKFVSEAYKSKKYAYVADYFRMKYMYENGCVTLDTDVELVNNLDKFLIYGGFTGQEIDNKILACATMGFEKYNPILKMILDYYDCINFDINNMIPNTQFITKIFELFIKEKTNYGEIILKNDIHIFPQKFFCNYNHNIKQVIRNKEAYSYHLFNGSWLENLISNTHFVKR